MMAGAVYLLAVTRVLDLGCGYGSTARNLADKLGCRETGTNISVKELDLDRQRAAESGLTHLLSFEYEDFHSLAYPEDSYEVVWSQEAFLHSADKNAVLSECRRVLKPSGSLIFTDILVRRDTPVDVRQRIYERVQSPDMWDLDDYRSALYRLDFSVRREEDWSHHVARSYGWVRDRLQENREALLPRIGGDVIDRTLEALSFWVHSAQLGYIGWAMFVAAKPGRSPGAAMKPGPGE